MPPARRHAANVALIVSVVPRFNVWVYACMGGGMVINEQLDNEHSRHEQYT